MPPRLTQRRIAMLQALHRLTQESGPPRAIEWAAELGITGPSLSAHISALEKLGYLERTGPRGRILLTERARPYIQTGIPIYGQIAAGTPAAFDSDPEAYTPSLEALLGVRQGDFLLEVSGESMTGIGIMPGDYVLIRPACEVRRGQVAAVLVAGETTLKRVYVHGAEVALESENPAMPTLRYPAEDVSIQGHLIGKVGLVG